MGTEGSNLRPDREETEVTSHGQRAPDIPSCAKDKVQAEKIGGGGGGGPGGRDSTTYISAPTFPRIRRL